MNEETFDITGTPLAKMAADLKAPVVSPYSEPKMPVSPVSVISTEAAKDNLSVLEKDHNQDLERLSVTEKNAKINKEATQKKAEVGDRTRGGLSVDEITALGGDVSQYTVSPISGLYMPKTAANPVDEFQKDQEEIDKIYEQQVGLVDQSTQAVLDSIKNKYGELAKEQRAANEAAARSAQSFNIRSGISRYTGGTASSIQNSVVSSGIRNLSKLASDEFSLIMQAESARSDKKYQLFAEKRSELKAIRDEKKKTLVELQKEIQKKTDEARKQLIQSSRDDAIAGLLNQGITDPSLVLNYLNFDEKGNRIGDFTAKEVETTLKSLAPESNIDKLSGSTRDFFILKGMNQLPANILGLPENQQLFAYLEAQKKASTVPGSGSSNKLTLAEAKSLGLPLATVGMSEDDILASLYSPEPPAWFREKVSNEMRMSPTQEVLAEAWEEFRQEKLEEDKTEETSNYKKARQFFSATYDGLTDEQINTIARQVETYVNGGMSYADAVEQTKEDLE
jgi:hypothetical protein